jgi:hypothetical protein
MKFLKDYRKLSDNNYDSALKEVENHISSSSEDPKAMKRLNEIKMSIEGLREEEKDGETTSAEASQALKGFHEQLLNKRYREGGRKTRRRSKHRKTHRRRR